MQYLKLLSRLSFQPVSYLLVHPTVQHQQVKKVHQISLQVIPAAMHLTAMEVFIRV
ncbi:MAG: hypothetical protein JWR50_719 [Mucilaginibacter sp.]|nr:hypothetical protein [Mucilaginibacter sp.]